MRKEKLLNNIKGKLLKRISLFCCYWMSLQCFYFNLEDEEILAEMADNSVGFYEYLLDNLLQRITSKSLWNLLIFFLYLLYVSLFSNFQYFLADIMHLWATFHYLPFIVIILIPIVWQNPYLFLLLILMHTAFVWLRVHF